MVKAIFKIVLLGDRGVGKSVLLSRLVHKIFDHQYSPTIGVDIITLTLNTNDGVYQFKIYDCSGDVNLFLAPQICANSVGCIVTYNSNDPQSIQHAKIWKCKYTHSMVVYTQQYIKINSVMCGLQCDTHNMTDQLLCSAKTGYNIYGPFLQLLRHITCNNSLQIV